MARTLTITPQYLAVGSRTAIRSWSRKDRSSIERWPADDLPVHWRAISPVSSGEAGQRQSFAVMRHCDATLIGRITLREIAAGCARIGIVIHPELRGQGYGQEALRTFLVVARQPLRLAVLRLDVASDNHRARWAYERAGWVEIGSQTRGEHRYIEMARGCGL